MISSPAKSRCPQCGRLVEQEVAEALPFCSVRCQQIDLRRWLGEEYGLPANDELEEDDADSLYGSSDA